MLRVIKRLFCHKDECPQPPELKLVQISDTERAAARLNIQARQTERLTQEGMELVRVIREQYDKEERGLGHGGA